MTLTPSPRPRKPEASSVRIERIRARRDVNIAVLPQAGIENVVARSNAELRRQWVDGYQATLLADTQRLAIRYTQRFELVAALGSEYSVLGNEHGDGHSGLDGVLERANRRLLLLGESGSGKTMALIDLAASIVAREPRKTFAFILSLADWKQDDGHLADWLSERIGRNYGVQRAFLSAIFTQGDTQVVLFLDGLDELDPERREACAQAINAFIQDTSTGLVLACQNATYNALGLSLRLNAAIELLPLDPADVESIVGERWMESDQGTWTPLLVTLAARTTAPPSAGAETDNDEYLWEAFLQREIVSPPLGTEREGDARSPMETPMFLTAMGRLARLLVQMKKGAQLYPEEIDISWVPEGPVRDRAALRVHRRQQLILAGVFAIGAFAFAFVFVSLVDHEPVAALGFATAMALMLGVFVLLQGVIEGRRDAIDSGKRAPVRLPGRFSLRSPLHVHEPLGEIVMRFVVQAGAAFALGIPVIRYLLEGDQAELAPIIIFACLWGALAVIVWLCLDERTFEPGEASVSAQLRAAFRMGLVRALLYGVAFGIAGGIAAAFTPATLLAVAAFALSLFVVYVFGAGVLVNLSQILRARVVYREAQRALIEAQMLPPDGLDRLLLEASRRRVLIRVGQGWRFWHASLARHVANHH